MTSAIDSGKLAGLDSQEKTEFMKKVYTLHCLSAGKQRNFVDELPKKELSRIEGRVEARKDAALACQRLLTAARNDLDRAKQSNSAKALLAKSIGVASGYRSAQRQFENWRQYFPKYYALTAADREKRLDGRHGDAAAIYLSKYIAKRLAAPGFSLHNSGFAIDFETFDHGCALGPSKSQTRLWKQSWFFDWLKSNANKFGFNENKKIDEPWHWEFTTGVRMLECEQNVKDQEKKLKCAMEKGDDYPL